MSLACITTRWLSTPQDGERNNKHKFVTDQYKIPCIYLYNQEFDWIEYQPKKPFLVLDKVYPQGVFIPQALVGMNMIHLPTVKTHVFTTITGAMKNAFGGLLHRNRHWTHAVIHDTLVDLLTIQQDIHPGIFAVMDGTFAGDGPGPRAMRWHEKDILLASADQVAIDAVSAKLQGFDPMQIRFIRRAHEMELGIGDPRQIEILGYDIEQEQPWGFVQEDTFASRGQKLIYHGPLKPFEKILLQSPLVPWSLFCQQFLPQCLLVSICRAATRPGGFETTLGTVVPHLRGWTGGHARYAAKNGCAGSHRAGRSWRVAARRGAQTHETQLKIGPDKRLRMLKSGVPLPHHLFQRQPDLTGQAGCNLQEERHRQDCRHRPQ